MWALLQFAGKRRNLPFSVPNFDIVSVGIPLGGFNCDSVVRAIQDCAIDEVAVLTKKVHAVLGKPSCARETTIDGTPSYVELLTYLEMARDVKNPTRSSASNRPTVAFAEVKL